VFYRQPVPSGIPQQAPPAASVVQGVHCSGTSAYPPEVALGYSRMRVLETISHKAAQAGLPFLIIGGYAVLAHGYIRATADLDLLVPKSRRSEWRALLEELGFSVFQEASSFIQFHPSPEARLPVDLMLVAD